MNESVYIPISHPTAIRLFKGLLSSEAEVSTIIGLGNIVIGIGLSVIERPEVTGETLEELLRRQAERPKPGSPIQTDRRQWRLSFHCPEGQRGQLFGPLADCLNSALRLGATSVTLTAANDQEEQE